MSLFSILACRAEWTACQLGCCLRLLMTHFGGAQSSSMEQPLDMFYSNVAEAMVPLQKFLLGLAQVAVV